jgi:hypothetical protein
VWHWVNAAADLANLLGVHSPNLIDFGREHLLGGGWLDDHNPA